MITISRLKQTHIIFYRCHKIKHGLDELKHICNSIFEKNIVLVEENLIIGVYEGEITEDLLLMNLVICILKWNFGCQEASKVYKYLQ
jgi:hypothetical protein